MLYSIHTIFLGLELDPGVTTGLVAIAVALIGQIAALIIQSNKDKIEKKKVEQEGQKAITEIAMSLVEPIQEQLQEQRLENQNMLKTIKELKDDLSKKTDEIYRLNHQILELETEIKDLKEINAAKDKQIVDMQSEIDSLRAEVAEYRSFIEENKLQFKRTTNKRSSSKEAAE